jgi:uncharacterized protein YjbI with pentapeptide repeats
MGCDFRDGTLLVSVAGTVAPAEDQMEISDMGGTKMARADLAGAKLHHAVIKRTDMSAAVLRHADLSGANLTGSSLKDADLRGANLSNCDLSRTLLNRAIVDGANLSGAVLRDANVFSVDFRKAAYLDALDLRESISVDDSEEAAAAIAGQIKAHDEWVETSGTTGARADFLARDLSAVDFSGRNLTGAVFTQCRLRAARFDRCRMSLAILSRADATGASFAGADLKGADLTGAILRRADFRNADLQVQIVTLPDKSTREWPVRAPHAKFNEADFTGAQVAGMLTEGAEWTGAKGDKTVLARLKG